MIEELILKFNHLRERLRGTPIDQCCDYCNRDTRMGTGRFVNRIGADVGYICPDCSAIPCDRCDEDIYIDCDITVEDGLRVHEKCLTDEESKAYE